MGANKNAISATHDKVGRGHCLSYHGSYTTDFNQNFTKMMHLGLATKGSHQLILKL